jgi:hypothetical protein
MSLAQAAAVASVALALTACASSPAAPTQEPRQYRLHEVPPALSPAVERGEAAMKLVGRSLMQRLQAELGQGGPGEAVTSCHEEAQLISAELARSAGVEAGRTSARLRNPANAPRPWAKGYVEATAGRKAADVEPVAFDLGDRVGLLRPITVGGACLACHGSPEQIPASAASSISARYPDDRATGFAEGDLRGFFWAEVKK